MLYQLLRQELFTRERDLVALGKTGYNAYLDQSLSAGEYQMLFVSEGLFTRRATSFARAFAPSADERHSRLGAA